jgi:nucleoside-diphosphate-sugar epimerase
VTGTGKAIFTEFTQERKEVEPGDYYADISLIKKTVGWQPRITLEEGIRRTVVFYKKYGKEYW